MHNKELTIIIAGGAGSGKSAAALAIAQLLMDAGASVTVNDRDGKYVADAAQEDGHVGEIVPGTNVSICTVQTVEFPVVSGYRSEGYPTISKHS